MTRDQQRQLRRAIGFTCVGTLLVIDVAATGLLGGGERFLAIVRSLVLPGLPFLEWHWPLGLATMGIAIAAIGAWLRWGMDWLLVLVVATGVGVAAFVMPLHHGGEPTHHHDHQHTHAATDQADHGSKVPILEASHEFTIVLVVFALFARVRLLFSRLPGAGWVRERLPEGLSLPAVDIARAQALGLLAGMDVDATTLNQPALRMRAARVNAWSRFRRTEDVLGGAHAPLRAALALGGQLTGAEWSSLDTEIRGRLAGVPDSEPTWVRPLDAMLIACMLETRGNGALAARWRDCFHRQFGLRHGRRPAVLHSPSMLALGTAATWEHATVAALARSLGWIGDEDWQHLRARCLGTAASGSGDAHALRLVAAGKWLAAQNDDREALEILGRRSLQKDPIAAALDRLAHRHLRVETP